jgi:hypothetical protein
MERKGDSAANGPEGPPQRDWGLERKRKSQRRLPRGGSLRSPSRFTGEPAPLLLAVTDLGPHPTLFAAHLAPAFTFPHLRNQPSVNEGVMHRQV